MLKEKPMFAISPNNNSVSKRRRKLKVVVYTIVILVLAIGLPVLVNKVLNDREAAAPTAVTGEVNEKIAQLQKSLEDNQASVENKTVSEDEKPVKEEDSQISSEQPSEASTTPAEPVITGGSVKAPAGYEITIPNNWYYTLLNEGEYTSVNFGSQTFGPDNPYSVNMVGDIYGYIVPATAIPSEALGPLFAAETINTNAGREVDKKVYTANVDGAGEITQNIYRFKVNEVDFGLVFYSATSNPELAKIDAVVKTLLLP